MIGTIIFIIVVILSILQDFKNEDTQTCINEKQHIAYITLIHHIIASFLLFGWIITPLWAPKLYLIVLPITVVYWFVVGYCHITRYVNKTCDWEKTKYFNDLTYNIKQQRKEPYLYVIGALAAIYRIKTGK